MQLIDSHAHLHLLDLPDGLSPLLNRARENGVVHMLCVSVDLTQFERVIRIAGHFPHIDASVGLHPNERVAHEPDVETLIQLASHPKIVALGETGLDYYRRQDENDMAWQEERFRNHIRAARQLNKPIIVHSRQARKDTIQILKEEGAHQVGAVLHCFTENWEMAKKALDLGLYISFSGIITFKNATELREVVKKVPLESLLIETDCPYLAPEPFRGKQNEPALVKQVAEKIAEIKQLTLDEVAEQTSKNYQQLFHHTQ